MGEARKDCPECGQAKPLGGFGISKTGRLGRKRLCKPCLARRERTWRKEHPERVRSWGRRWRAKNIASISIRKRKWRIENREKEREHNRRYRLKHPERAKARRAAQTAIRQGLLEIGPCENCGLEHVEGLPRRPIEAHHEDYGRPLEVRWLCRACHTKTHGLIQR